MPGRDAATAQSTQLPLMLGILLDTGTERRLAVELSAVTIEAGLLPFGNGQRQLPGMTEIVFAIVGRDHRKGVLADLRR